MLPSLYHSPVTQNLFDNPERALLGRGLIPIYPQVSTISVTRMRYYKLVFNNGQIMFCLVQIYGY